MKNAYMNNGIPLTEQIYTLQKSQKEKRGEGAGRLLKEIIAENSLYFGRDMDIQVSETQRTPSKINPKKATLRYIITKL